MNVILRPEGSAPLTYTRTGRGRPPPTDLHRFCKVSSSIPAATFHSRRQMNRSIARNYARKRVGPTHECHVDFRNALFYNTLWRIIRLTIQYIFRRLLMIGCGDARENGLRPYLSAHACDETVGEPDIASLLAKRAYTNILDIRRSDRSAQGDRSTLRSILPKRARPLALAQAIAPSAIRGSALASRVGFDPEFGPAGRHRRITVLRTA
jgi:hypothetical protein